MHERDIATEEELDTVVDLFVNFKGIVDIFGLLNFRVVKTE